MTSTDWPAVEVIYAAGIAAGNATFETTTTRWEAFNASRLAAHRLIAENQGQVLGWVAVSPVSARAVYAGVVEHSVYVIWTIQSVVFLENTASLALHRRAGFRTIGTRERIAQHHGRWRDTILIERRSSQTQQSQDATT